jgi:hypothetical protein
VSAVAAAAAAAAVCDSAASDWLIGLGCYTHAGALARAGFDSLAALAALTEVRARRAVLHRTAQQRACTRLISARASAGGLRGVEHASQGCRDAAPRRRRAAVVGAVVVLGLF